MRLSLAVIAFMSLFVGCRQHSEFEFRRANSIKTSSADETQKSQTVTEFGLSSQTEVDQEALLKEEQPILAKDQSSSPVTAERDQPLRIEAGGSATIINGNVEIHEHLHEHRHIHVPSTPLQDDLKSHEISDGWGGRDVEEVNCRRREELLRELHTKKPIDPYCEQKRLEHEARVRAMRQKMQLLIEQSRKRQDRFKEIDHRS